MHSSLQVFYGTTSGASCLDGSVLTNPQSNHNRRWIDGFWWQTVLRAETEKQFSACLKVHGHGITIKKLFHLAKQAGISIASNNCQLSFVKRSSAIANSQLKSSPISPISPAEEIEYIEDMPTFSQDIKDTLPSLCAALSAVPTRPKMPTCLYWVRSQSFPPAYHMSLATTSFVRCFQICFCL